MIIKIGDLQFGGNSKYQIEPGISGLSSAAIRTGDGVYSGADGAYVSSQLYGARTIIFTGFYLANSCVEADELRLKLVTGLRIRYLFPIYITSFSQKHYFTEGYITDIKADIEGSRAGEFQITILCPDPMIYDGRDGTNQNSVWLEQPFYKEGAGGFVIDYKQPVEWKAGQQSSIITNNGTMETYPILNLTGTFHSPTIRNLTTGRFITFSDLDIVDSTLLIDMKNRVITLNGVSRASYRTTDSTWWSLIPGENRLVLETTTDTDTDFGMIRYKQGYEGL